VGSQRLNLRRSKQLGVAALTSVTLVGTIAAPASALLATRTWVSGVGSDANACSRTAPCETFVGAFLKTETGGEIDVLDSGGFGALTITKSIRIATTGDTAGVLVSGTNGFVVDAPGENVVLKGLDFNGLSSGLIGLDVLEAASVRLEDSTIQGFNTGIYFAPGSANAKLTVANSVINDNAEDSVLIAPQGSGSAKANLVNDTIEGGACGVAVGAYGSTASAGLANDCGTNSSGSGAKAAQVGVWDSTITDSLGAGVLADGPGAELTVFSDTIADNEVGLLAVSGGAIVSLGGNALFANTTDGTATAVSDQFVSAGPTGPRGAQGEVGPAGAKGPAGAAGKIELISCKATEAKAHGHKAKQRCSGKLVSGSVKFTASGKVKLATKAKGLVRATLSQAGHIYAEGSGRLVQGGPALQLRRRRQLTPGTYTLTIFKGRHIRSGQSIRLR
jgi:hypothetical protein